jgi:hypothetical protein
VANRGNLQVKESELTRCATKLVNEPRREIRAKDSTKVIIRNTFDDKIKTNFLEQKLRKGVLKNRTTKCIILPEISLLEFLVELGNGDTESIGEGATWNLGGLVLF